MCNITEIIRTMFVPVLQLSVLVLFRKPCKHVSKLILHFLCFSEILCSETSRREFVLAHPARPLHAWSMHDFQVGPR